MILGALILAGGEGKRLGNDENKIFADVLGKTVLQRCIEPFLQCGIKQIIIVCRSIDEKRIKIMLKDAFLGVEFVFARGGKERQDSCKNGLLALESDITHVLIHDCARMLITKEEIGRCIEALDKNDAVITAMPLKDTIKKTKDDIVIDTPDRKDFFIIQTPQCFKKEIILAAHDFAKKTDFLGTDDASLVEHMGKQVKIVEGSYENIKITTKDDIIVAQNIIKKRGQAMDNIPAIRIGNGFDVHGLTQGRKLILGGVEIEHEKGLLGHSDADVLVHAIMDAILGALALKDVGAHFPDTDEKYKNADSIELLKKVIELMKNQNHEIGNIDAVIMAQRPKLLPYIDAIRENIAKAAGTNLSRISVKATTTEHLSFIGREEGIAASALVLLYKTS